jgi:KaiC/GvpD/RAD55 family RecA-like ATPase
MFSINSGIDGLNEMLNGGMPDKSITALVGPAGSGKTILSLQVLYANLLDGRKCIYMSAAHTTEELEYILLPFSHDIHITGGL